MAVGVHEMMVEVEVEALERIVGRNNKPAKMPPFIRTCKLSSAD